MMLVRHQRHGLRRLCSAAAAASSSSPNADVSFDDIARAAALIRSGVSKTPCDHSFYLSHHTGADVWLKKDLSQHTGSFKERGARNALLSLDPEQAQRGVIAASAGNHALALAWHGKQLGIDVTVLMPENAPLAKVDKCRFFGANVILHGAHIGEAKDEAQSNPSFADLTYINGYNDHAIVSGAGTMGLEILEQVPDVEAIVVPCGGAGLLAGIAVAVKTLRPQCKVYAVEPHNCASFTAALAAGAPVAADTKPTLADGLGVPEVGARAFEVARQLVDGVHCVSEKAVALAVLRCVEEEKLVVEGGGATGLAALLPGESLWSELQGKRVVVPLCGGNIDTTTLGRVIDRGLAADGRLVRFVATVSDKPGGIARMAEVLKDNGASIKDIYHERAWLHTAIDQVQVKCIVELTGTEHGERVRAALEAEYPQAVIWGSHASAANAMGLENASKVLQRTLSQAPEASIAEMEARLM